LPPRQVFISYAHTTPDAALASYLAKRLRDRDIRVWLDTESLPAGLPLQAAIEQGIAASDHGIFIVSRSWLPRDRDYTAFELEQFARRDPAGVTVRRIPIFREPRAQLAIPPELVRMTGLEWLDTDRDWDARFWQLQCALSGEEPGDPESWSDKGRASAGRHPTPAPPPPPRPSAAPASLRCDRALQWSAVDVHAVQKVHELLLLPGTIGQAHEHFVQRITRYLRADPPRSIVPVDWETRPRSQGEFLEALGSALEVATDGVVAKLGQLLSRANVFLLHRCIGANFVDASLTNYYTVWLPELLKQCKPQNHLKCVQPIEWPRQRRGVTQMLTWLRLGGRDDDPNSRQDAERLIETVRSKVAPPLRAFRIHDLADVTDDDLRDFCDLVDLTRAQRDFLLARIKSANAVTPKEIFDAIDKYLPDARSLT
jgi:hypothetical protein